MCVNDVRTLYVSLDPAGEAIYAQWLIAPGDGMHQLMKLGGEAGARRVITYVSEGNVGSLRGCANAGFTLDHVRITRQRFNLRRTLWLAPDAEAQRIWAEAIAPRKQRSGAGIEPTPRRATTGNRF